MAGIMRCSECDKLVIRLQDIVPFGSGAVALVEPLVMVTLHHLFLVEMSVYDSQVILYPFIPLRP